MQVDGTVAPVSYVGRDALLLDTVLLLYGQADGARQTSISQAQQTRHSARQAYLDVIASRGRQVRATAAAIHSVGCAAHARPSVPAFLEVAVRSRPRPPAGHAAGGVHVAAAARRGGSGGCPSRGTGARCPNVLLQPRAHVPTRPPSSHLAAHQHHDELFDGDVGAGSSLLRVPPRTLRFLRGKSPDGVSSPGRPFFRARVGCALWLIGLVCVTAMAKAIAIGASRRLTTCNCCGGRTPQSHCHPVSCARALFCLLVWRRL